MSQQPPCTIEALVGVACTVSMGEHMVVTPISEQPASTGNLVLTPACELAQDKLLGQTADNMQAHVNPKRFEYMPRSTIRTGVISGRNGVSN